MNAPDVIRFHRTLLSLQDYAAIMGMDALRLAGGVSAIKPSGRCDDIWFEYDWQDDADKVSRDQLLHEIAVAEYDIATVLRWWPGPVWVADERQPYPHHARVEVGWRRSSLTLRSMWGHVLYPGVRSQIAIAPASVTRAAADIDADGDGFLELAHFTVTPPTGTLPAELRAFFKNFDALDADNCRTDPGTTGATPEWEVYPLQCRANGATIEVYVPVWWLFRPQLRYGMTAAIIDADSADSYVDTLQFYRETVDATYSAQIAWLPEWDAGTTTANLVAHLRQPLTGMLHLSGADMVDSSLCGYGTTPHEVRLWYAAGAPVLDHFWQECIAYLTTARLTRPLCSCGSLAQRVEYWQQDLSKTGESVGYQTSPATLTNLFGTRRGEDYVWKRIQRFRQARPVLT